MPSGSGGIFYRVVPSEPLELAAAMTHGARWKPSPNVEHPSDPFVEMDHPFMEETRLKESCCSVILRHCWRRAAAFFAQSPRPPAQRMAQGRRPSRLARRRGFVAHGRCLRFGLGLEIPNAVIKSVRPSALSSCGTRACHGGASSCRRASKREDRSSHTDIDPRCQMTDGNRRAANAQRSSSRLSIKNRGSQPSIARDCTRGFFTVQGVVRGVRPARSRRGPNPRPAVKERPTPADTAYDNEGLPIERACRAPRVQDLVGPMPETASTVARQSMPGIGCAKRRRQNDRERCSRPARNAEWDGAGCVPSVCEGDGGRQTKGKQFRRMGHKEGYHQSSIRDPLT